MTELHVLPFKLEDLSSMDIQERHGFLAQEFVADAENFRPLLENGWAWTGWLAYGVPIASVGIMEGGAAWAFLSRNMKGHMVKVTWEIKRVMQRYITEVGPIYAEVDSGYVDAVRWVKALGFNHVKGQIWVRNQ